MRIKGFGGWTIRSQSDPRWNAEGDGFFRDMLRELDDRRKRYGAVPQDMISVHMPYRGHRKVLTG